MNQPRPNPEIADIPNADYRALDRTKLTPMMQYYADLKDQYPQALLLFRVGDFFECFFQDAITISRELELFLTGKESGKEIGRVPMTGVPHHALERYSSQLVEKGYAVVVCDQVEDAAQAAAEKRMVDRQITKVLTPGTLTDTGMLPARKNNFLGAIVIAGVHWGLAHGDVSTGEFFTTQGQSLEALNTELLRLQPAEILFPVAAPEVTSLLRPGMRSPQVPDHLPDCFCYSLRNRGEFELEEARQTLTLFFQVRSLEGLGCEHLPLAIRAAGGLLAYVQETQRAHQVPLQRLKTYQLSDFLVLDHQTRRNLELTQTVRDGTFSGSLLWALDMTCTAMGGRALRRWLLQPLLEGDRILERQGAIAELVDQPNLRQELRRALRHVYDLERLAGRVGANSANAKEMLALAESLIYLSDLATLVAPCESELILRLSHVPPDLARLGARIVAHIVETPPLSITEGGLIRPGINAELDERRRLYEEDQQWLAQLEIAERDRLACPKLKVGYNKTFGYYLSLPRSQADRVPAHYIRKQTLTNEERYITPELKERETRILHAQEELNHLEYEIFNTLRQEVAIQVEDIRACAAAVATVDALGSLAEVASIQNYCRPEILTDRTLMLQGARHPVVEKMLPQGLFVPNDAHLGDPPQAADLVILTGPNASGKSCYLRQLGLIQLLAQVGSFVPAKKARLAICDRIFTRVGAVDDLATGQSTFMVEMNETANILNHATGRSLVLLDEIGRGTATFDGLSIAWAVAEHLARDVGAKTIFATHYHELNELASFLDNVANYQVTVQELPEEIIFLHQVRPGGADRSYGIEAGRLAGLPPQVIRRAQEVMAQIEKHSKIAVGLRKEAQKHQRSKDPSTPGSAPVEQLTIF